METANTFLLYKVQIPFKYCQKSTEKQNLNFQQTLKILKSKGNFKGNGKMNFSPKRPMEFKISGEILENLHFQILVTLKIQSGDTAGSKQR